MTWIVTAALMIGISDWPEFRANDGVATGTLPLTWSDSENIRWKTPIHGRGWSSPIVIGKQIWLTTAPADGKQLFAICVDADSGNITHDLRVFDVPNPSFCHPTNSYASCTAAAEIGRVYVHFGSAGTACLDTTSGKVLWERRDLPCDHFRSAGSSPILFANLLIIHFDGIDVQYVVALDKSTGKTVWKRDRDIDYGGVDGDYRKAYGTPRVIEVNGKPQLVSPTATHTLVYDPLTGAELWRVRHGGMNAAARPLFSHGLVLIAAGDGGDKLIAVRPDGKSDVTSSHVAWRYGRHVPKRATGVVVGDLLFMAGDDGFATCLEVVSGKELWSQRIGGTYWSSPVAANGRVYFFSQEGDAPVVAAEREFKQLARNRLDDGCNASPAIIGDDLIVRTKTHLYRIGSKAK